MKVLLLADTYSEHTEKWALGLAAHGVEVGLFSFNKSSYPWYQNQENISLLFEPKSRLDATNSKKKLSYLRHVKSLRKVITVFKPDVLHAHYATSYGLVGALSKFHPFVISAWGTDVMKFPQKNIINKSILKHNLRKADAICATSYTIREYLKPVTNKSVHVIPFGINPEIFKSKIVERLFNEGDFVFGCIKSFEKIYNIDLVIKAFSMLKAKHSQRSIKLMLVGEGSEADSLRRLSAELKVDEDVLFTGRIPFSQIADYYNKIDVFVNISEYESFGVSVIEAMACEKPVIVTNTGGLKEIVETNDFGSLIELGDQEQLIHEMEKYLLDEKLAKEIGKKGREKVLAKYNWNDNVLQMIDVYKELIKK